MSLEVIDSQSSSAVVTKLWYAVYTRHQHEKSIVNILTRKGFDTFLPLYQEVHRWKDRSKVVSSPLFPCYVFLKGDVDRRLDVMTTPGVHSLVTCAGQLAGIQPREIENLRQVVESGSGVEPHPFLKCGERVRIKHGPLAGVQGLLVRKKSLCRLVLSIEILARAASVEVDTYLVEKISNETICAHSDKSAAWN